MKLFKRNLISLTFNPKTENEPIYDHFISKGGTDLIPKGLIVDCKINGETVWNVEELKADKSIHEYLLQHYPNKIREELMCKFQPEQPDQTLTVEDILDMRSRMLNKPQIETIDGEPPVWYVAPNVYQLLLKHIYDSFKPKSCTSISEEGIIYGGLRIEPSSCLPDNTYVTNIKEREDET